MQLLSSKDPSVPSYVPRELASMKLTHEPSLTRRLRLLLLLALQTAKLHRWLRAMAPSYAVLLITDMDMLEHVGLVHTARPIRLLTRELHLPGQMKASGCSEMWKWKHPTRLPFPLTLRLNALLAPRHLLLSGDSGLATIALLFSVLATVPPLTRQCIVRWNCPLERTDRAPPSKVSMIPWPSMFRPPMTLLLPIVLVVDRLSVMVVLTRLPPRVPVSLAALVVKPMAMAPVPDPSF